MRDSGRNAASSRPHSGWKIALGERRPTRERLAVTAERTGNDSRPNEERTECEQAVKTHRTRPACQRHVSPAEPSATGDMKLAPTGPPGRITRKARAFAAEILQLRDQGYTFEAIRAALADAGVRVSSSTVRREATKTAVRGSAMHAVRTAASDPTPATLATGARNVAKPARGKEAAEAFFSRHHTNPLLPPKEKS